MFEVSQLLTQLWGRERVLRLNCEAELTKTAGLSIFEETGCVCLPSSSPSSRWRPSPAAHDRRRGCRARAHRPTRRTHASTASRSPPCHAPRPRRSPRQSPCPFGACRRRRSSVAHPSSSSIKGVRLTCCATTTRASSPKGPTCQSTPTTSNCTTPRASGSRARSSTSASSTPCAFCGARPCRTRRSASASLRTTSR